MIRSSGRLPHQLRPVSLEIGIMKHAEGSCLVKFGETQILVTATVEERVPPFLRHSGKGWVTAEYGMLPRSTGTRMDREAVRGKQSGRTQEIQRLIGRSLRAIVNTAKMGERQILVDCDVIQADGGTRTASITGAYVAVYEACRTLVERRLVKENPLCGQIAAVSCGLYKGTPILDLDYEEDSRAEADANFVLTHTGNVIEIQATAEDKPFPETHFQEMFSLARQGIAALTEIQNQALGQASLSHLKAHFHT